MAQDCLEGGGERKALFSFFVSWQNVKEALKGKVSQLLNLLPITGKSRNFIIEENLSSTLLPDPTWKYAT